MGLRYFEIITNKRLSIEPARVYKEPERNTNKAFLIPTAKEITLAEYNPVSSDSITAHKLADYRRRQFSLVLLPDVHILIDDLLKVEDTDVSL